MRKLLIAVLCVFFFCSVFKVSGSSRDNDLFDTINAFKQLSLGEHCGNTGQQHASTIDALNVFTMVLVKNNERFEKRVFFAILDLVRVWREEVKNAVLLWCLPHLHEFDANERVLLKNYMRYFGEGLLREQVYSQLSEGD